MSHHHHHDHQDHSQDKTNDLTFPEKMIKLLDHWTRHNHDHAKTYSDWAAKATEEGLGEVAATLEEVAEITRSLNSKFEAARKKIETA